ncbi:MAG: peptidyl-prolyl cis-trans isomerase [Deltaproteobacteria bacterium]
MKMADLYKYVLFGILTGCLFAAPLAGQQSQSAAKPAKAAAPAGAKTQSSKPASAATKPAAATPSSAATQDDPKKVVMKVGTLSFTAADMDFLVSSLSPQLQRAVAVQGKKPLGEQYAMIAALSQQAEKDSLEKSADVQQELAFQRLQALAQAEYRKISDDIKVTPEEIKQYYDGHGDEFEQAQVREIVIRKKADDAKADAPGLSAAEAHARADEIRKAFSAGTDPKQVTEKFALENAVQIDAEPRVVKRGDLIPALDEAAFKLKDGSLSDPFENAQALAFLQVVGHTRQDLKDATETIADNLHNQKLEAFVEELKKKANVWMDDQYFTVPAQPSQPAIQAPQPQK